MEVHTVRANTDEFVRDLLSAGDRALERMEREARKHPAMAVAVATVEVVGTVITFGAGETIVAGVATYVAYRALKRREAKSA
jgi:hypothetical protein